MKILKESTIAGINLLPEDEKRRIYSRSIPAELLKRFNLPPLDSVRGNALTQFRFSPGSSDVEISLYSELRFPDPLLYGHITDTISGQIHILLYVLNDPDSPRFNVDRMADGTPTRFGTLQRNLEAERAALDAGLAPGQVRRGLRLLPQAINAFEDFVTSLGHDLYFVEPLYYHNAVIFERYGFAYQIGRRLMENIQTGFSGGGELIGKLDGSTPFRASSAAGSVRLRSWAIHDGLMEGPFTDVTMYKHIGQPAGLNTAAGCNW